MGRALADAFPEAKAVFDSADRALDHPVSQICFEGSAEDLALTENTQPAILTVSIAALRVLESRGLHPVATAGHSLGEYSAHVAAGTLPFEDAVRAVRLRGRFMQRAVKVGDGAMAAILGLELADLERVCEECAEGEVVSPANMNGPGQIVIAGHAGAVQRAMAAALTAGASRALPLPVSAPFHCSLMSPAADELRPVLEEISFFDPVMPVFTNVDAAPVRDGGEAREALVRQVATPVRWHELVQAMVDSGIDTFLEVGPGRVLAGLMRRIRKDLKILAVGDPDSLEKAVDQLC
jgi:[acyl-carrier-protein] S-malonyltransferase